MLSLPLFVWVLKLVVSDCRRGIMLGHQHLGSFKGRNMMLMVYSSSPQDSLYVIFIHLPTHFYTFALPSFICCSRLHLNLLYLVPFTYVRYYLLVLFVTLKTSFVPLQVFIFLTDQGSVVYSHEAPSTNPMPCPLRSHTCAPLHHTLCLHFSRTLLLH